MSTAVGLAASRVPAKRKPLVTAAGIGLVFLGFVAMASTVRVNAPAVDLSARPGPPGLVILRLDRMSRSDGTRDRLELLDPTPLFMPRGESLVGSSATTLNERPGGRVAESFAASLTFPAKGAGRDILAPVGPGSALDAMVTVVAPRHFEGLTRADRPTVDPVPKLRAARVEIYRTAESEPARVVDLDDLSGPVPANWRPVELSLLVTPAGMVARPAIVSGSGTDEMDQKIRSILVDDLLIKAELRPGIYRIVVGP